MKLIITSLANFLHLLYDGSRLYSQACLFLPSLEHVIHTDLMTRRVHVFIVKNSKEETSPDSFDIQSYVFLNVYDHGSRQTWWPSTSSDVTSKPVRHRVRLDQRSYTIEKDIRSDVETVWDFITKFIWKLVLLWLKRYYIIVIKQKYDAFLSTLLFLI